MRAPRGRGAGPRAGSCRRRRTGRGSAAGCRPSTSRISACASASSAWSRVFSQTTSRSMMACRRSRSARCGVLGREAIGMRGRVVDELGEQDRAGGRERPARPPEVQRRRVAVADRLLARRLPVDRLERQRDLDQLALRCPSRHRPSYRSSSAQNGSRPRAQVVSHLPRWPVASKSPASKRANGFSR